MFFLIKRTNCLKNLTENVISVIRTEIAVNNLYYIVTLKRSLSPLNDEDNEACTINLNQHLSSGERDTQTVVDQ